jgi:hypothetical protein
MPASFPVAIGLARASETDWARTAYRRMGANFQSGNFLYPRFRPTSELPTILDLPGSRHADTE